MPTFTVYATASIGVFKSVEAATEEEARTKAESLGMPSLCHHCTQAGKDRPDAWELSDGIYSDDAEITDAEEG